MEYLLNKGYVSVNDKRVGTVFKSSEQPARWFAYHWGDLDRRAPSKPAPNITSSEYFDTEKEAFEWVFQQERENK